MRRLSDQKGVPKKKENIFMDKKRILPQVPLCSKERPKINYQGDPNMVEWGSPEKIMQNAVQTC